MVGEKIRALRRARGWRQKDLAARSGVTTGMIGHIETGDKEGSLSTIQAIADALDVNPGLLLDGDLQTDHLSEISTILEGAKLLDGQQLGVIIQMMDALRLRCT